MCTRAAKRKKRCLHRQPNKWYNKKAKRIIKSAAGAFDYLTGAVDI
jgi:hypothetical protein